MEQQRRGAVADLGESQPDSGGRDGGEPVTNLDPVVGEDALLCRVEPLPVAGSWSHLGRGPHALLGARLPHGDYGRHRRAGGRGLPDGVRNLGNNLRLTQEIIWTTFEVAGVNEVIAEGTLSDDPEVWLRAISQNAISGA